MKKSIHPEQPDIYHRHSPASPQVIMPIRAQRNAFSPPGQGKAVRQQPVPPFLHADGRSKPTVNPACKAVRPTLSGRAPGRRQKSVATFFSQKKRSIQKIVVSLPVE